MKPHRIEDLGRIRERLFDIFEIGLYQEVDSKHDLDAFIKKYSSEDILEDLFYVLKCMFCQLEEIKIIADGDYVRDF